MHHSYHYENAFMIFLELYKCKSFVVQKIEPVSCLGSLYFFFIEVCDKLFPNIPRTTIKSWMRNLGLKLVQAPQEIEDKLRTARPYSA